MRNTIILLHLLLLFAVDGKCQRGRCNTNTANGPYCKHFHMPEFEGGKEALYRYLSKNILYPDAARENNIEGRVIVHFTIKRDGNVDDIKVTRGIGGGCDEEAARVVRGMPPWKAARHKRKNIVFTETLPVEFRLE